MATNLEFIKSLSPDGSSSSVSLTDVFSESYDVYVVTYHIVSNSGSPKGVNLRLINSSDSIISSSNYDYAFLLMTTYTSFTPYEDTGAAQWTDILGYTDYTPEGCSGKFEIYNPFSSSSYSFMTGQSMQQWNGAEGGNKSIGVLKETTSCTGFNIFIVDSVKPTFGSKISVYGVKGSSQVA